MNIAKMMKQAQKMQQDMAEAQAALAAQTVEASVGGGKVTVIANGGGDIVSIKIDPEVVDPEDVEMLEDLVLSGVHQAAEKAKELAAAEMSKITGTYPFYSRDTMPSTIYKGVPAVDLPYLTVYWVAHQRVPAKAVQDILELVYQPEIKKQLAAGHKAWAQMEPDTKNFLTLGVPMHPGAEAYYKAKGLWQE